MLWTTIKICYATVSVFSSEIYTKHHTFQDVAVFSSVTYWSSHDFEIAETLEGAFNFKMWVSCCGSFAFHPDCFGLWRFGNLVDISLSFVLEEVRGSGLSTNFSSLWLSRRPDEEFSVFQCEGGDNEPGINWVATKITCHSHSSLVPL